MPPFILHILEYFHRPGILNILSSIKYNESMNNRKTREPQQNLFRSYLIRHLILVVAVVLLVSYYALRNLRPVADFATTNIAQPWSRFAGSIFGVFPFSVAECLSVFVILGVLAYIIVSIIRIIRYPERLRRMYAMLITLLAGVATFYMLICWLWGIGYYSYTFAEQSGIEAKSVSAEELKLVTIYFAEEANKAAERVERDVNDIYVCDTRMILTEAPKLYKDLPAEFAFIQGPDVQAKPLLLSCFMSHTNFSGVFVPFTGESNINIDIPDCFIPATVAHELSHQRGVMREQDANFTAILTCMRSDDANYNYSGALLAYTNLARALKQANPDYWEEVKTYVSDKARKDLEANNKYWEQFQTPIADISEATYEEFLHDQGQELGLKSYGACVDLLVAYYGEAAQPA